MDVQLFDDAAPFLAEAAAYLDSDPFSASVIAGYARSGWRQSPAEGVR